MKNIIYIDQIPHGTNLETWPVKPIEPTDYEQILKEGGVVTSVIVAYTNLHEQWMKAVAFARSQCIPIAESDQEKVKELIIESIGKSLNNLLPPYSREFKLQLPFPLVDFTIYKDTGINFTEVIQLRKSDGVMFGMWEDTAYRSIPIYQIPTIEYRAVLRLKSEDDGWINVDDLSTEQLETEFNKAGLKMGDEKYIAMAEDQLKSEVKETPLIIRPRTPTSEIRGPVEEQPTEKEHEQAVGFLMNELNASEYEDARDEYRGESWNVLANIMIKYAKQKSVVPVSEEESQTTLDSNYKITRVEVIDQNGRSYVNWDKSNHVYTQLQDEGRTLKVFISRRSTRKPQ